MCGAPPAASPDPSCGITAATTAAGAALAPQIAPPPPSPPPDLAAQVHPRRPACTRSARRPGGEVVVGNGSVRFTVLTAALLRLEHHGAAGADDRPSLAVVHRRLRPPEYSADVGRCELLAAPSCVRVRTGRVELDYAVSSVSGSGPSGRRPQGGYAFPEVAGGPFEESSLRVRLRLDADRWTEWWPGKPNHGQLPGTFRTLDGVRGAAELDCGALPAAQRSGAENSHCEMGLISRDGWALLDDSLRGRLGVRRRGDAGAEEAIPGWERWAAPLAAGVVDDESTGGEDARCAGWAGSGECESNPSFMQASCAAACRRMRATARGGGERGATVYLRPRARLWRRAARLLAGGRRAAAAAAVRGWGVVLAVVAVCRFRDARARRPV